MPRRQRFCPAGIPVHVIQRGNNRQTLFTSDKEVAAYAHWLGEGAAKYDVQVHGWVFMTNHVHLLVTPGRNNSISLLMQSLGRRYVALFNFVHARSGTLFEGRFRSSVVQEENYFLTCLKYIELNPVRAGMVRDPKDYRWSSYSAHGLGIPVGFWLPHPSYLALGDDESLRQVAWRGVVNESMNEETVTKIRHCVNTGLVLGSGQFRAQVAGMTS